jgi:hypothetical protein
MGRGPDVFIARRSTYIVVTANTWETPTEILKVSVAPGTYLITARLRVLSLNAEKLAADCSLSTGDSVHLNHIDPEMGQRTERIGWPVVLHDVATFDRASEIRVLGTTARDAREGGWLAEQVVITALQIGAVNPATLSGFRPYRGQDEVGSRAATYTQLSEDRLGAQVAEIRSRLERLSEDLEIARRDSARDEPEQAHDGDEDHP